MDSVVILDGIVDWVVYTKSSGEQLRNLAYNETEVYNSTNSSLPALPVVLFVSSESEKACNVNIILNNEKNANFETEDTETPFTITSFQSSNCNYRYGDKIVHGPLLVQMSGKGELESLHASIRTLMPFEIGYWPSKLTFQACENPHGCGVMTSQEGGADTESKNMSILKIVRSSSICIADEKYTLLLLSREGSTNDVSSDSMSDQCTLYKWVVIHNRQIYSILTGQTPMERDSFHYTSRPFANVLQPCSSIQFAELAVGGSNYIHEPRCAPDWMNTSSTSSKDSVVAFVCANLHVPSITSSIFVKPAIVAVTCDKTGFIEVFNQNGILVSSKKIQLDTESESPFEEYPQCRLVYLQNIALVAVFCEKDPFALLFYADDLSFICEVPGAANCIADYYLNPLQQSLLWLPKDQTSCTEDRCVYLPCLMPAPSRKKGKFMILHCSSSQTAVHEGWKTYRNGAVVSLKALQKQKLEKNGSGDQMIVKPHVIRKKTKKRKAWPKADGVTTGTVITSANKEDNTQDAQDTPGTSGTSGVQKISFGHIARSKQESILTALKASLANMNTTLTKQDCLYHDKHYEYRQIQRSISAFLRDNGPEFSKAVRGISHDLHKPFFTATATDNDRKIFKASHTNEMTNSRKKHVVDPQLCDVICLCNERAFSLLLIARVVNNSMLPVFDISINCNMDPECRKYSTDCLKTKSAIAPILAPNQEAWIAATVPLSPTMFQASCDIGSGGQDLLLKLDISMIWKDISCNIQNSFDPKHPSMYYAAATELTTLLLSDESRSSLEVRNGFMESSLRGSISAILDITPNHMNENVTTSFTRVRKDTFRTHPTAIHARTYYTEVLQSTACNKTEQSLATEKNWARKILKGWLRGYSKQVKPMPSSFSVWSLPARGIRYYSYLQSLDLMIKPKSPMYVDKPAETSEFAEEILAWVESIREDKTYKECTTQHGLAMISFVHPDSLETDDPEYEEKNQEQFLDVIPELAEGSSTFRSRLYIPAMSEFDTNTDQHIRQSLPVKLVAPLLPHASHLQNSATATDSLHVSLRHLNHYLAKLGLQAIELKQTDSRRERHRLAVQSLLEELKLIASTTRLSRERQQQDLHMSHHNLGFDPRSMEALSRAKKETLELVLPGLYAPRSIAAAFSTQRFMTDMLVAYST